MLKENRQLSSAGCEPGKLMNHVGTCSLALPHSPESPDLVALAETVLRKYLDPGMLGSPPKWNFGTWPSYVQV